MYDTNRISNYNLGKKYTISSQIFNCLVETKKKKSIFVTVDGSSLLEVLLENFLPVGFLNP